MNLSTFGPDFVLRLRLENQLKELRKEDRQIQKFGLETLTNNEVTSLLVARAMRTDFPPERQRKMLKSWLKLSLDKKIPLSLLIMSRTFNIGFSPEKMEEMAAENIRGIIEKDISTEA